MWGALNLAVGAHGIPLKEVHCEFPFFFVFDMLRKFTNFEYFLVFVKKIN